DAERELNEARNARDQALTDLRNAVLNYMLTTGQLRVTPDGDFHPLPRADSDERPAAPPTPVPGS
ncbi:MAG: TolC family protein, partial [Phycisphaerales bacterium]|nr:TolC family protein [Phycisphaerales bacterium]